MRGRSQQIRAVLGAAWGLVTSAVEWDEIVLCLGLVLLTFGLWPIAGKLALVVPGAVLVWMTMPQRGPFVITPPSKPDARRKD